MHKAAMFSRHASSFVRGAGSKCRKKYCDEYARKPISAHTDGMASRDIEKEEHGILMFVRC
jgi:hypothetical protein